MTGNRGTQTGFTLLEVLVALALLVIAFLTSFFSLNTAAREMIAIQDKTAENWIALNVIAKAQLKILALPVNNGSTTGKDQMFDSTWQWKLAVYPTADVNISRITVDVQKQNNSGTSTQLTGYLLMRPPS